MADIAYHMEKDYKRTYQKKENTPMIEFQLSKNYKNSFNTPTGESRQLSTPCPPLVHVLASGTICVGLISD